MKLDKTLEEILLQNKSLTDDKFNVTREYFKLRLEQEDKLSKLSRVQSEQINANKARLKAIKNISMEKIHKYSVKYKKAVNPHNISRVIKMTFEDLINEFDYNCLHHYKNNKDIIVNYITEFFNLYLYKLNLKKELKSELKSFNRTISSALSIQLVSEYNIFKRNVEVITKLEYNIEKFKVHLSQQQTLEPIITEIFLSYIEQTVNKNYIKDIEKENNIIDDIKMNDKVKESINIFKKEKVAEIYKIVGNIVQQTPEDSSNTTTKENVVEKVVEEILNRKGVNELIGKLYEQPKKTRKKRLTKEEKEILEKNEAISMIALRNMYGGILD